MKYCYPKVEIDLPAITKLKLLFFTVSPELIDLHIRLMRKAKKNVNPERWQRTLAKFCYLYYPQDCWELEQNGYKKLDFKQRLKILLVRFSGAGDLDSKVRE